MPSIEHEQIVEMMAGGLGLEGLSVSDQREIFESTATQADADVLTEVVNIGSVSAEWISITGTNAERVVLYLHGGAYTMGSANTHRALAGRIARASCARVLLPNYRLAPEHPFPAAVEDAVACWRWLLSQGYLANKAAIAGDSAGGGLALAAVLSLKAAGETLPACIVGLSPWLDLEATGTSAEPGAVDDPMLTRDGLRSSGLDYAPNDLTDPLASPLFGDLQNMPPVLLQVGTREVLLSDSTRFAEKARASGVDVTLDVEEGLIHVWHMLPGIPEAQESVERIGKFIADQC